MAIPNITNANTFGQWLSTTQSVVSLANTLTDGPSFTANTHLQLTAANTTLTVANTARFTGNVNLSGTNTTLTVANTASFTGNVSITGSGFGLNVSNSVYIGGDLLVGGNVTLDSTGFDDLYVTSNTTTGNITITSSTTTANLTVTGTANVQLLSGNCVTQFDAAGTGVAMAIALG